MPAIIGCHIEQLSNLHRPALNYDILDELRKRLPVYSRFGDIVFNKEVPADLAAQDPLLKDTVVNVRWVSTPG